MERFSQASVDAGSLRVRDRIIVREEDSGVLLYNGDNGCLIHVRHDAFERFVSHELTNADAADPLRDCLRQNGFLNIGPSIESPSEMAAGTFADGVRSFFDLRSQRSPLNVLWALTPLCNLRCLYCFPDAHANVPVAKPRSLDSLLAVVNRIIDAKVLKIILSGGECLLLPDVWEIAERLRRAGLTVTLLSNGAPITERVAQRARALGLTFGVSLDGPDEEINAATRGRGAFRMSVRGIRRLLAYGVPLAVLVTVTRYNFDHLERLMALLGQLGVTAVTLQDLRPFGTREIYDRTRLTRQQEQLLPVVLERITAAYPAITLETSELFICWKKKANDRVMQCPAGDHFAYIDFHGDVYPCTSLPSFKLGNVFDGDSLMDLWRYSAAIRALRRVKHLTLADLAGCRDCVQDARCDGGCRGDALFYRGDLLGRPSRCRKELGEKS